MLGALSDTLLLVHLIWSTSERQPVFAPADDVWLADFIAAKARALSCELLAVGNWVNHVHVVVRLAPALALSELARQFKGAKSHAWNLRGDRPTLRWQTGYWARSVDQGSLARRVEYALDQRMRHEQQRLDGDAEMNVPRESTIVGAAIRTR
ncbi:MAG: transposase [Deltaproteobacteria bacterium]|nr:transposase [Deltaproteobacteria bacterium]